MRNPLNRNHNHEAEPQIPLDFEQMERDIQDLASDYAKKPKTNPEPQPKPHTATQLIAQSITQLTWREAEAMGAAISTKLKSGDTNASVSNLTAAIQSWAAEWETFSGV